MLYVGGPCTPLCKHFSEDREAYCCPLLQLVSGCAYLPHKQARHGNDCETNKMKIYYAHKEKGGVPHISSKVRILFLGSSGHQPENDIPLPGIKPEMHCTIGTRQRNRRFTYKNISARWSQKYCPASVACGAEVNSLAIITECYGTLVKLMLVTEPENVRQTGRLSCQGNKARPPCTATYDTRRVNTCFHNAL